MPVSLIPAAFFVGDDDDDDDKRLPRRQSRLLPAFFDHHAAAAAAAKPLRQGSALGLSRQFLLITWHSTVNVNDATAANHAISPH